MSKDTLGVSEPGPVLPKERSASGTAWRLRSTAKFGAAAPPRVSAGNVTGGGDGASMGNARPKMIKTTF